MEVHGYGAVETLCPSVTAPFSCPNSASAPSPSAAATASGARSASFTRTRRTRWSGAPDGRGFGGTVLDRPTAPSVRPEGRRVTRAGYDRSGRHGRRPESRSLPPGGRRSHSHRVHRSFRLPIRCHDVRRWRSTPAGCPPSMTCGVALRSRSHGAPTLPELQINTPSTVTMRGVCVFPHNTGLAVPIPSPPELPWQAETSPSHSSSRDTIGSGSSTWRV